MRPARPSECSPPSAPSRPRTEATETTCREDKGGSGATGTAAAAAGSASLSGREVSGGAPPPCDGAVVFSSRCREKQTASCLLRCCEGWGSPSGCCFPRDQTQASRDWGPREGIACWLAWGGGKRRRKRGRAAALGRDRVRSPEGATEIEAGTWSDHESAQLITLVHTIIPLSLTCAHWLSHLLLIGASSRDNAQRDCRTRLGSREERRSWRGRARGTLTQARGRWAGGSRGQGAGEQ